MELRSDRRFRFDVGREVVWAAVARTDQYRTWWPWLREFDGSGLEAGRRWRCVVKPPLPYRLRFDIVLAEVIERELVRATIEGDINGWAELTTTDESAASDQRGATELRLVSELELAKPLVRLVARIARPALSYGHDWVLDTGARQFAERALRQ